MTRMALYGHCSGLNVISTLQFIHLLLQAIEIANVSAGNSLVWREEKKKKVQELPAAKEPTIEQVTCEMDCLYGCSYEKSGIACSFNALDNTCSVFDTPFVTFIDDANSVARIRSMPRMILITIYGQRLRA